MTDEDDNNENNNDNNTNNRLRKWVPLCAEWNIRFNMNRESSPTILKCIWILMTDFLTKQ